jgi:hypothetical protein
MLTTPSLEPMTRICTGSRSGLDGVRDEGEGDRIHSRFQRDRMIVSVCGKERSLSKLFMTRRR